MESNGETSLDAESQAWVEEVLTLQNLLHHKLLSIAYQDAEQDDNISHHLAEASYAGSDISRRLVPKFLKAEGTELAEVVVDLVADLNELRESIKAMEEDLVRLMNHLNP